MAAIDNDWLEPLSGEFKKPYYRKLYTTVKHEYETRKVFPAPDDIFNAFAFTPLSKVKVVILMSHFHCLLQNNRAGVRSLVHKMAGRTCHFYAPCENSLVHFQTVIAGSAKGRDERWMNVNNTISVFLDHNFRNHDKESRQNNKLRAGLLHRSQKCLMKFLPFCKILRRNASVLNSCLLCPFQGICVFIIADYNCNFRICDSAVCNAVNDCLQVCTASGNQNCDF